MSSPVQSGAMTPKEFAPVWRCRHCRHKWLIVDEDNPPKQCPNRKCRRMDWDRAKVKSGRPRQDAKTGKAKAKTARKKVRK